MKPPDPKFIREETIEYQLRKDDDGTSDLFRIVKSDLPGAANKQYEKKICDGIREMLMFTTNRKPINIRSFSPALPFKSLLTYEPYELDGTGPYLVHVMASFVRKGDPRDAAERIAHTVKTCFSIRGKLNGVHP